MATVNYSVPSDVKRLFDETFAHRNKSAIVADLLLCAVEEKRQRERRAIAIDRLLALRPARPCMTATQIREARDAGRR